MSKEKVPTSIYELNMAEAKCFISYIHRIPTENEIHLMKKKSQPKD
jgi:hypothetical protein